MIKPTAKELWEKLVDEAGEDEVERAASITVEQAEKELAEAGFDVAAERARRCQAGFRDVFLAELIERYPEFEGLAHPLKRNE